MFQKPWMRKTATLGKNLHSRKDSYSLKAECASIWQPMQWIIVGLGNPGPAYAKHRHNVGFWALESLKDHFSCPPWMVKKEARLTKGHADEHPIILCCPQTYMNLSGQAVSPLRRHYPEAQFLVIHDELDLPCGQLRLKKGGSTGGHNGLKSIHPILGPDYWRIRIGIDRPGDKGAVSDYVLSSFPPGDRDNVLDAVDQLTQSIHLLITGQEDAFVKAIQRA